MRTPRWAKRGQPWAQWNLGRDTFAALMVARPFTSPLLVLVTAVCSAQVNVPVNGPADKSRPTIAFTHAIVHPAPGEAIMDGTVLIQADRIIAVGAHVDIPADAVVNDLHGLHIWPGLIEPYEELKAAREEGPGKRKDRAERTGGRFWNDAIRPAARADELYTIDAGRQDALRAQGFTAFITHRMDGIARGTGCAVLAAGRTPNEDIIAPRASAQFSFRKGTSVDDYPNSLMGAVALIRQTLYDARWYAQQGKLEQSDADLQALNDQLALPLVFEAGNRNDVLRIARLGQEFGLEFIVKGGGDEYARLGDILATKQPLIVPLALPEAYDVEDPFEALEVSLAKLKQWELAPTNPARIAEAGGTFAFTGHGLKETATMWAAIRRMVRCGLDSATAIAALTTVPAKLFHLEDRIGALRPGLFANLVISSHHLLDARDVIHETWVAGKRYVQQAAPGEDPRGVFDLNLRSAILKLNVSGEVAKPEAEVSKPGDGGPREKATLTVDRASVTLLFNGQKFGFNGPVRLNGTIHPHGAIWDGQGQMPGGEWIAWSAVRQGPAQTTVKKEKKDSDVLDSLWSAPTGQVWFPLGAYGVPMLPDTELVVFRHATVWTNGPQGVLHDADVCIAQGRILSVGPKLDLGALFTERRRPTVMEIDATGKHLTCGIIDEHSHIAIERGVNEGSQAITAEVRIGDVTDPDDVDIYRNLAGGVTAVQQLHGSANPIGGQSALTKLRWGQNGEQMHIAGADGYIKFALGENVKQSNWSNEGTRFPQTRMGVEQLMYDAFHRAKEYDAAKRLYQTSAVKKEYGKASLRKSTQEREDAMREVAAKGPRVDLELEALAEILNKQRFITCHSYVQSEVAMLMDVADSMGFAVQTFTHILEGYKVARRMKEHGVNASTFSDWWAYKMEVGDAIPYNAALLYEAGVNTCINSDDAEMSRRLNQEAAKTMKYGGVPAEDAWKMVTLNPAKALRLNDRMGSVEAGKDADIVLWSANPLSIDAKAEMTFVDGVRRFDRQKDVELREAMRAERERLITKMIAAKKAGAPAHKAEHKEKGHWRCETIGEEP
jgi:imidazolonepropionase-like amidohydrolase